MSVIYDVLLKQQNYKPVIGHFGEPKYTCIFYDENRNKALKGNAEICKRTWFYHSR